MRTNETRAHGLHGACCVHSLPLSSLNAGRPGSRRVDLQSCVFVGAAKTARSCSHSDRRSASSIPSLADRGTSIPQKGGGRPPGIASETKATRGPSEAPGVFQRPGVGAGAPAPVLDPPSVRKGRSVPHSASNRSAVAVDPPGSCRRIPKGFQRVLLQVISRKPFALQGFRTTACGVIACFALGLGFLIASLARRYR